MIVFEKRVKVHYENIMKKQLERINVIVTI